MDRSERETRPAAAGRCRLWIVDLERGADQVVDEVDLRPREISNRDRVDQYGRAVAVDDEVVVRPRAIHVELVLEARAAAAFHAHAQHGSRRLTAENLADAPRRPFGDCNTVHCQALPASLA